MSTGTTVLHPVTPATVATLATHASIRRLTVARVATVAGVLRAGIVVLVMRMIVMLQ